MNAVATPAVDFSGLHAGSSLTLENVDRVVATKRYGRPLTKEEKAFIRLRKTVLRFFQTYVVTHFLTLTYDDLNLPASSADVRKFFKRVQAFCLKNFRRKIPALWKFEYGKLNGRPHVHIALSAVGFDFPLEKLQGWWLHGSIDPDPTKFDLVRCQGGNVYDQMGLMGYFRKRSRSPQKQDIRFIKRSFGCTRLPPAPEEDLSTEEQEEAAIGSASRLTSFFPSANVSSQGSSLQAFSSPVSQPSRHTCQPRSPLHRQRVKRSKRTHSQLGLKRFFSPTIRNIWCRQAEKREQKEQLRQIKGFVRLLDFYLATGFQEEDFLEEEQEKKEKVNLQPGRSLVHSILTSYIRSLLPPLPVTESWSLKTIFKKLRNAFVVVTRRAWHFTLRDDKQRQCDYLRLFQLIPALQQKSPLPYVGVHKLSPLVRCLFGIDPPDLHLLREGKKLHKRLEERWKTKDPLPLHNVDDFTTHVAQMIAEINLQIREQTLHDPALNLYGKMDHVLLTNEGFVVRDDKFSSHSWKMCYLSIIVQLHVYAFILQSIYPHLPCRALQVCVHSRDSETCQLFTFMPAWEWFLPIIAELLLLYWGVIPRSRSCPPNCQRPGDCPAIAPFPLVITLDEVTEDQLEALYSPAERL